MCKITGRKASTCVERHTTEKQRSFPDGRRVHAHTSFPTCALLSGSSCGCGQFACGPLARSATTQLRDAHFDFCCGQWTKGTVRVAPGDAQLNKGTYATPEAKPLAPPTTVVVMFLASCQLYKAPGIWHKKAAKNLDFLISNDQFQLHKCY